MNQTLRHQFNGTIWKIEIEEQGSVIAIETRDISNHTASFSAFDFKTGACCFKEVTVENSWWHGLDKIHEGMVFLHGYKSEANPERKGIIALDLSGEIKWQQFNLALETISSAGLVAYNTLINPKQFVILSAETGDLIGRAVDELPLINPIVLPRAFEASNVYPYIPQNIEGLAYNSEYLNKNIWSFHTKSGEQVEQHLLIEEGGEIIFSDKLAIGIQKLNPEAFFLLGGFLIYIRNKNEIVAYSL